MAECADYSHVIEIELSFIMISDATYVLQF